MSEMAVVGAFFLAAAAVIRSFRSIETQSLLAIRAGKMIWDELFKKPRFMAIS
jgi:hypothetical protein